MRSAGISFLPRMVRIDTDGWGALFSHRIQNTEFGSVGMAGMPYPRHLLWDIIPQNTLNSQNLLQRRASHGFHRFTQILRVRCSPTEFTEYTELGSVGMAGMPYPPNLCASVSSVGGSSLPEGSVRSVRSVGEHRSSVGALETSAPPME